MVFEFSKTNTPDVKSFLEQSCSKSHVDHIIPRNNLDKFHAIATHKIQVFRMRHF